MDAATQVSEDCIPDIGKQGKIFWNAKMPGRHERSDPLEKCELPREHLAVGYVEGEDRTHQRHDRLPTGDCFDDIAIGAAFFSSFRRGHEMVNSRQG